LIDLRRAFVKHGYFLERLRLQVAFLRGKQALYTFSRKAYYSPLIFEASQKVKGKYKEAKFFENPLSFKKQRQHVKVISFIAG